MIYNNIVDFSKQLQNNRRLIGLDVGRKTIGVALSDRDKNIATAKFIIQRKSTKNDLDILVKYIQDNDVCGIVSGLPLNADGDDTKSCNYIKNFIVELDKVVNLPIFFEDEFLSSFVVEDFFIDGIGTKSKKVKDIVDKHAAAVILQSVLDKVIR
ncbi:MAG: Holliday junction resolvase RuvX [Rickettsiales bacterium]|nr:Holliday junction resolvase RuvX [Rickettsiales bacterium]